MANRWPPGEGVPDFQEQLAPLWRMVDRFGRRRLIMVAVAVAVLLWLGSGFYVVGPGERGVVLWFGRVVAQTDSGLRYRLPAPFQQHHIVDIASVRRAEIGFRSDRGGIRPVPSESLMLTGDENIVEVQLFVQYLVRDPVQFLFRARQPELALHSAAEVALRSAVGQHIIDYTMTEGRVTVQDRVKLELQGLLDRVLVEFGEQTVHVVPVDGQVIGEVPVAGGVGHVLHTDNDPQAHAGSPTASSLRVLPCAGSIGACRGGFRSGGPALRTVYYSPVHPALSR